MALALCGCDAGNYNAINLATGKAIYLADCALVKVLDGGLKLTQILDWSSENGD